MQASQPEGVVETANGLAWRRLGEGPPLVLINGYAATKDDWDPGFLAGLARASTVIALDNRGMGESLAVANELTVESMAADAAAVMDAASIDRPAVVGWSMGSFVAQQLAATAPERVEALVLLSSDPGGKLAVRRDEETQSRLTDHTGTPDEQAKRLLDLLFPAQFAASVYEQFGDIVAAARAQLADEALSAQERAMGAWYEEPSEERLAAIRAPVLIAAGEEDGVIPPSNADLLSQRLPGSWLARFPACGHAFMAQEPARLSALINAFLGRTP